MACVAHHQIARDDDDDDDNDEVSFLLSMLIETNSKLRESATTTSPDDGVGDIVGFEEDVEVLLHEINNSRERHFVTCIDGFGGSGKTTLARELYMNADVVDKFERRVWVSCSEFLSEKELLVNLLRLLADVDGEGIARIERVDLREMVIEQLQRERCFVVLDDIRGLYSFQDVVDSLDEAEGQSILLLTSSRTWNQYDSFLFPHNHHMKPLDVDKSWQLLLNTMLCSNDQFPKHVVRRGKTMLMKNSGGLPLAVKEVAMEWLEKRQIGIEWEEVVESEDLKLRASLEAIESSVYQNLDPDHKLFFLHLGFFKQGTTIRTRRLLQTWIASGALGVGVSQREGDYKSCISVFAALNIMKECYDEVKNYHVEAICHKLAISKLNEGASHRVVYRSRERFNCSTDKNEGLICVSFNGGGCLDASPSYWKSFEQLRVLEFEGFGLRFLPEAVGELIELRYLGLRNNYIQELPISLGCLKNLEVLDIALNFMMKVPDILWEMDALVHLYMSDIFCMKPLRIETLKNLQTLTYISVNDWAYEVSGLQMMTSLRKLGITEVDESSNVSKLFASLAGLERLFSLVLRGSRFRSMPLLDELGVLRNLEKLKLDGFITKLPSAENFPPYLNYLILVNSCVDEDPMPILEKLENLCYLKLQNAYTGQQMTISKGGFPDLGHLCIVELWHLRNLQVAEGALLQRMKLEITSCPYLHSLPEAIINKKNLELNIVATKNIGNKTSKSGYKHRVENLTAL